MEAVVMNSMYNQATTPANETTRAEQKVNQQLPTIPASVEANVSAPLSPGWVMTPMSDASGVPVGISVPHFWAAPASSSIDSKPGIGIATVLAAPMVLGSTPTPFAVASLMPITTTTTTPTTTPTPTTSSCVANNSLHPPLSFVTGPATALPALAVAAAYTAPPLQQQQSAPNPSTWSSHAAAAEQQYAFQQNCWVQQMLLSALFAQQQQVMMLGSSSSSSSSTTTTAPFLDDTGGAPPPQQEEPPYLYYNPEFKPKRPLSAYNFFL